jgi:hypothetical protein
MGHDLQHTNNSKLSSDSIKLVLSFLTAVTEWTTNAETRLCCAGKRKQGTEINNS